ncbi:hypothetical protein CEUSTIGMA_g11397.t1 [Chlamydomonas eustigma]|uniref:Thioredoxin domain-containing protein n=1 Tax=Chlamydomonas eustigma TaxID=1157962 RepID=A0A250XLR9_9CHLO|nr:hypothetical protein CEUSTIGMA_g11397.t1 [Chlamydomonas eustigma]|eukprot:GAX83973.1 hypothetical protein CEUSTIGMA_g11397.t1 [Chlamydomonas eustigma]
MNYNGMKNGLNGRLQTGDVRSTQCTPSIRHHSISWRCRSHTRDLWGYPQTNVQAIDLPSFRLMHRASFSHRNWRSYVVVVYVPGSTKCAEIEYEVERLATGLMHEPNVVVTKLNALSSTDAFTFCNSVLETKKYPSILLYPEGSPGCMKFMGGDITAEGILSALNGCYKHVLGHRQALALMDVPPKDLKVSMLSVEEVKEQRPQPLVLQDKELQQVRVVQTLLEKNAEYWTGGKVLFWSFVVLFSVGSFIWDKWGEDWLDRRELLRRQQERKEGKVYDEETNAEDLLSLNLIGAQQISYSTQVPDAELVEDMNIQGSTQGSSNRRRGQSMGKGPN